MNAPWRSPSIQLPASVCFRSITPLDLELQFSYREHGFWSPTSVASPLDKFESLIPFPQPGGKLPIINSHPLLFTHGLDEGLDGGLSSPAISTCCRWAVYNAPVISLFPSCFFFFFFFKFIYSYITVHYTKRVIVTVLGCYDPWFGRVIVTVLLRCYGPWLGRVIVTVLGSTTRKSHCLCTTVHDTKKRDSPWLKEQSHYNIKTKTVLLSHGRDSTAYN